METTSLQNKKLKLLRLVDEITASSPAYNQFSLPLDQLYDITLCSYFLSELAVPKSMKLFEGDHSVRGFFRVLRKAFSAEKYDILHAHSPHVAVFFLLAKLLFPHKIKATVYTVHNSYKNYKWRNRLMLYPIFAFFDRSICCGINSKKSMPWLLKRVAGKRLDAVQNGMNIERVDRTLRQLPPLQKNSTFVATTVMRLIDLKNIETLIDAFAANVDSSRTLVIVGDGEKRQALEQQANATGLNGQIAFRGLIARDEVYYNFARADVFVSTSRGEGLPIAVLEAMACRRPVILSDIPPHREIAEGVDFIPLIKPDDTAGFAHAMQRFREMHVAQRAEIGAKCRNLVEEKFDMRIMHRGYHKRYLDVLGVGKL